MTHESPGLALAKIVRENFILLAQEDQSDELVETIRVGNMQCMDSGDRTAAVSVDDGNFLLQLEYSLLDHLVLRAAVTSKETHDTQPVAPCDYTSFIRYMLSSIE